MLLLRSSNNEGDGAEQAAAITAEASECYGPCQATSGPLGVRPLDSKYLRPEVWQVPCCQSLSIGGLYLNGLTKDWDEVPLLSHCFPHWCTAG